jgi:hypothetical protein
MRATDRGRRRVRLSDVAAKRRGGGTGGRSSKVPARARSGALCRGSNRGMEATVENTQPSCSSIIDRRIVSWRSKATVIASGASSHRRVEPSISVKRNVTVLDGPPIDPVSHPDARRVPERAAVRLSGVAPKCGRGLSERTPESQTRHDDDSSQGHRERGSAARRPRGSCAVRWRPKIGGVLGLVSDHPGIVMSADLSAHHRPLAADVRLRAQTSGGRMCPLTRNIGLRAPPATYTRIRDKLAEPEAPNPTYSASTARGAPRPRTSPTGLLGELDRRGVDGRAAG